MGISGPLTWPVEKWYTIQGQQSRQPVPLTYRTSFNTSYNFHLVFFLLLFYSALVKRAWNNIALHIMTPRLASERSVMTYLGLKRVIQHHSIRIWFWSTSSSRVGEWQADLKHSPSIGNRRNATVAKKE